MKSIIEIFKTLGLPVEDLPDILISGPARLSDHLEHGLSFLSNPKYEPELYTTQVAAVLVDKKFQPRQAVSAQLIRVDDPYSTFSKVLGFFNSSSEATGISEHAIISDDAIIGDQVYIGALANVETNVAIGEGAKIYPHVHLGNHVKVGKSCILYPGVKVYDNCEIGDNSIIHAGTVIGSDGFGFVPQKDGTYEKIPQTGNVVIGENVEIGSNCTIDRASIGSTIIEDGVKLDNLIQVGHNALIGTNTVVAAQAGISGSTSIGNNCMIGGQVGFVGHISIAPFTLINAKSGISKSIKKEGSKVNGIPAFSFNDSLRSASVYRRLPEIEKKLREIEEILSLHRK